MGLMTDETRPIQFTWDGEAMQPRNAFWAKRCDEQYVVGQDYRLAPYEERSMRSHGHFFACLTEAWRNLPEALSDRFPSPEALRKYALIKAGYRDERVIAAATSEEASKLAAFARSMDDYAVVVIDDNVVTVLTAKSQSMRAMDKATFQKSKDDVLRVVAELVHVTPDQLKQNAGVAA
jgi:hypothetical protein